MEVSLHSSITHNRPLCCIPVRLCREALGRGQTRPTVNYDPASSTVNFHHLRTTNAESNYQLQDCPCTHQARIRKVHLKMGASLSGKDLKFGTSYSTNKSTESWPHSDNAAPSHYLRPRTNQRVSSIPDGKEPAPTIETNDYESPQNATDSSSIQEIRRTEHSVPISNSTAESSMELTPITVQDILSQEVPAITPAHADDTALDPTISPSDHPTQKISSTHTLLSNRGSSTLSLASITAPTTSRLGSSDRELQGRLDDHSSDKLASSDIELPLSLRRQRRPPMPTSKLKNLDPSPLRKRKASGDPPTLAAEKRQRTTRNSFTNPTAAYGTPRATPMPQSSATVTQSSRPMPILSAYQQNHTTLRVSVTTNIYASILPIKLRSCITMKSFFFSIVTATRDAVNRGSSSSDILVSFCWKDATDGSRTMLLRKDTMDTFRVFLETIDEAPCWNHVNGKCEILVDVV